MFLWYNFHQLKAKQRAGIPQHCMSLSVIQSSEPRTGTRIHIGLVRVSKFADWDALGTYSTERMTTRSWRFRRSLIAICRLICMQNFSVHENASLWPLCMRDSCMYFIYQGDFERRHRVGEVTWFRCKHNDRRFIGSLFASFDMQEAQLSPTSHA